MSGMALVVDEEKSMHVQSKAKHVLLSACPVMASQLASALQCCGSGLCIISYCGAGLA
jgi:hypothetical protein